MQNCSKHQKPYNAFCQRLAQFVCVDCPEYYSDDGIMIQQVIQKHINRMASILKQGLDQPSKKYQKDRLLKQYENSPWLKSNEQISCLVASLSEQDKKLAESLESSIVNGKLSSPGTAALLLRLHFPNSTAPELSGHVQNLTKAQESTLSQLSALLEQDSKKQQPLRVSEDFELLNSRSAILVDVDSDKEEEYEPIAIPSPEPVRRAAEQARQRIEELLTKVKKEHKKKQNEQEHTDNDQGENPIMKDSEGARKSFEDKQKLQENVHFDKPVLQQVQQKQKAIVKQPEDEEQINWDVEVRKPAEKPEANKRADPAIAEPQVQPRPVELSKPQQIFNKPVQSTQYTRQPEPPLKNKQKQPEQRAQIQNREEQLQKLVLKQKQEAERERKQELDRKRKEEELSRRQKEEELQRLQEEQDLKERSKEEANRKAKQKYQRSKTNKGIIETVVLLMKVKKYAQALQKLQQISKQLVQSPTVVRIRAKLLHYQGKSTQSLALYGKLIQMTDEPKHYLQKAVIELQTDNLAECEKTLRTKKMEIPSYHIIRGDVNYKKGAYGQAQRYYDEANERRETATAYGRMATCHMRNSQWTKAIKSLDAAIRLDDKNSQFYNDRGVCYLRNKNYPQACNNISKALELSPTCSAYFNNSAISQLHKLSGVPNTRILDEMKFAYDLNPDDLLTTLNYCAIYEKLMGPTPAVKLYEQAVFQKSSTSPKFSLSMYKAMMRTSNQELIEKAYHQLIALYNNDKYNNELRLVLCKCMAIRGDEGRNSEAGKKLLAYVINHESTLPKEKADAKNTLAQLYLKSKSFKEAIEQLRQITSLPLHSTSPLYNYNLAYCLYHSQSYMDALGVLQKLDNLTVPIQQALLQKATTMRIMIHAKLNQKTDIGRLIRIMKQEGRFADKEYLATLTEISKRL